MDLPSEPIINEVVLPPKKPWLPIIITLLFLASSALAVYFYLQTQTLKRDLAQTTIVPTPSPYETSQEKILDAATTDWQTYTNSRYGYQLKHPAEWTIEESEGAFQSQLNPEFKNQKTTLSNGKEKIDIFFEGEWDHGFDPWVPVLNTTVSLGNKSAQLVVFKQDEAEPPDGGWAVYTIPEFNSFRIETTYTHEITQILSTFKFIYQATKPTPSTKPATVLNYSLPSGYLTIQDMDNNFEIGIDPKGYDTYEQTSPNHIMIGSFQSNATFNFYLKNYAGGSRHQFIYDQLNYDARAIALETNKDAYEKEYNVDGHSCLIIYGLNFSARGNVWGMCVMSPSKAIFFEGMSSESENKKFIQTFKLLKTR